MDALGAAPNTGLKGINIFMLSTLLGSKVSVVSHSGGTLFNTEYLDI
jgi:hypothetical protein